MPTVMQERPVKNNKAKLRKKRNLKDEPLTLPTKKNIPPSDLSESVIMIYGRKGIGKTSLAAMFEKSLTFMFERGRRNLEIMQVPQKKEARLDWKRFIDYVELFLDSDFETGVIDTIDRAYITCYQYVCNEYGIKTPENYASPYTVWDSIGGEFDSVLSLIQESDKGLILLSHEKARPLITKIAGLRREDEENTFRYERLEPSCKPAAFRFIQEICDFVLYYGFAEEYRCITVRSPNDVAWTSCGMSDRFLDPDGNPINTFKVGTSPTEAYESLCRANNNELYDIDYIPPRKKVRS